jgi:hypothetical protein
MEKDFLGGYTIVREYVARALLRSREMFLPLSYRPGHAQAVFSDHHIDSRIISHERNYRPLHSIRSSARNYK